MNWGEAILQWLHVLFGTLWFGGALFANFVVVPSMMKLPPEAQQQFVKIFAKQSERVMLIAASGAILLGFLRGTVFGDIKSFNALGTAYGIYWLIGLIAACLTYAYGAWYMSPRASQLGADLAAAEIGPGEPLTPELAAKVSRVTMLALLELVGFFVIFTAMIAMHFAGEA